MNPIIEVARAISPVGVVRMWQRNWTIFRKIFWLAIAPTFIEPFIYLLSLGIGLGLFVRQIEGMSYLQFLAPGLMASTVMFIMPLFLFSVVFFLVPIALMKRRLIK